MENNTPREDVSSEIVRNDERQKLLASGPIVKTVGPKETSWREKCRKCSVLSCLFMAYLLVSAAYSIIAPFYPQEVGI